LGWGQRWSRRLGWERPVVSPGPPVAPVVLDPASVAVPLPPAKPAGRGGLFGSIVDGFTRGVRGG